MTGKIHDKNGVFVPPNSHFTYVLSITLPQPTIRIRIPRALVKAMQRRNQARSENDENGGKNKVKHRATSKKSFRKKVGSMFSNVFGKKNSPGTDPKDDNGEVHSNVDGEEMKKLKNMIESVDMGSEKMTGKSSEEYNLNDEVEQIASATGFGASKKGMQEAGDEGKEKPIVKEMVEAGNERKERPKSRRTFSKSRTLSKMNDLELNKAKINNVDDIIVIGNTDLTVACVGNKGANTLRTKAIVSLKQAENSNDLTRFRSKTLNSNRKVKTAWSMKKMTGGLVGEKSDKQELCKKRIIMGGRCRPLNHSGIIQYDENGVLIPEIIP
ncbi:uncharacterized protein LOC111277352 [Durio zibethinus]|uniref:Uncharacterized protein LOC111277352 n=1 Tax=Durio zibethinus TaxID=66656 RepID=A0A6P5WV05_DURZI|nr:uncharacterized protein LOC111277352 [Durio zibethinus]